MEGFLQGLQKVTDSDQGGGEAETKTVPETWEMNTNTGVRGNQQSQRATGNGKTACANSWPLTCHLSRVTNDRWGAEVKTTMSSLFSFVHSSLLLQSLSSCVFSFSVFALRAFVCSRVQKLSVRKVLFIITDDFYSHVCVIWGNYPDKKNPDYINQNINKNQDILTCM